jgi:nitronate monooxygenase
VILDQLSIPIVLAPLAGGPSTPQLAAAVSDTGGFGFLAAGYPGP